MSRSEESMWGDEKTKLFLELTPDRVLRSVEASGLQCTGRCMSLNSFENRVYDVELEIDDSVVKSSSANRRVAKFYRPGRWTEAQILEEHEFLKDCIDAELPVIAPLAFADGRTLHQMKEAEIRYALFPKVGGRAPDEFTDEQLLRVGRYLGRLHAVGAKREARHRLRITPDTYGYPNLDFLLSSEFIPKPLRAEYESLVKKLMQIISPLFGDVEVHRLHGDCHPGNLLWNDQGPFFLDFDDMVIGPAAQDIWLLVPGRDAGSVQQRNVLLEGYEEMKHFDRTSLRLIEPLRTLRFIHYSAWIARRWNDPAFPLAFPEFGSQYYWTDEINDLRQQLQLLS